MRKKIKTWTMEMIYSYDAMTDQEVKFVSEVKIQFFFKPRMTPKCPPNDPQGPPMTHQRTPSEPPMTTNDNQLGHFWFPDVVK